MTVARPSQVRRLKYWFVSRQSCPNCRVFMLERDENKQQVTKGTARFFCKNCGDFFLDIIRTRDVDYMAFEELERRGKI